MLTNNDINNDEGLSDPVHHPQVSAQHDQVVSLPKNSPVILYGREIETSRLAHAWRSSRPGFCTVVVHGKSGTGKTALVKSLRDMILNEGPGCIVASSYPTASTTIAGVGRKPYSAIADVFSDMWDSHVECSQAGSTEVVRRGAEILQTMGSDDFRLVAKIVPGMTQFLESDDSVCSREGHQEVTVVRNSALWAKFKMACQKFLRVVSSELQPIVMFLDDIHSMDEGSREIIKSLYGCSDRLNVMLIVTYRDEDVEKVESTFVTKTVGVINIHLFNLTREAVTHLISDKVGSTSPRIPQFSDFVYRTTMGNPFHICQFFDAIQGQDYFSFDPDRSCWKFDVNEIQCHVPASVNLMDLLSFKIAKLKPELREALKIASHLECTFTERILFEVMSLLGRSQNGTNLIGNSIIEVREPWSMRLTRSSLDEALRHGYLEMTKEGYRFTHAELKSAFQSTLHGEQEKRLAYKIIGDVFLAQNTSESVFYASIHLNLFFNWNQGSATNEQRLRLARINRDASSYCADIGGFAEARNLLQNGISLLDSCSECGECFELAVELTESLARMELIVGNFDSCNIRAMRVPPSTEGKTTSLLLDMEASMAAGRVHESIAAAEVALRVLGIVIPQQISTRKIFLKAIRIQRMMIGKLDRTILSFPLMDNKPMAVATKILFHLSAFCFLKEKKPLSFYSALLATELTLIHGLSPYSSHAFLLCGLWEFNAGHRRSAIRLKALAISLHDKMRSADADCATTAIALSFLTSWNEPLEKVRTGFVRSMECGFQVGDFMYAAYSAMYCSEVDGLRGETLALRETFLRDVYGRIRDSTGANSHLLLWLQPSFQFVLNMMQSRDKYSNWMTLTDLSGEIMVEGDYMRVVVGEHLLDNMLLAWTYKAALAYYFGYMDKAESIYVDIDSVAQTYSCRLNVVPYYMFGALIHYTRFQVTRKRKDMIKARRYKKLLQGIKAMGCSHTSCLALLNAVESSTRVSSTSDAIMSSFDDAIKEARDFVHLEALANELAGFACARNGAPIQATHYLAKAIYLYRYGWGAIAKADWLQEKSKQVLGRLKVGRRQRPCISHLNDILEMSDEDNTSRERSGL